MLNPYNYFFDEASQTYHFTTKNDIEYRIAFIIDHTFSAVSGLEIKDIYQIIIDKISDEIEKFDSQVSATIQSIVDAFFTNSQNSMIYICDDKDKKGEKRFNAFERWYQNSHFTDYILKVDNVIVCNSNNLDYTIFSSLLYHHNNNNKETILEIYQTIQEILNDK